MARVGSQRHWGGLTNIPVPVVARSRAQVFGHSHAEILGLNPTGAMDVCLLRVLCVVR